MGSWLNRKFVHLRGQLFLLKLLIRLAVPIIHSATPELLYQFPSSNRTGAENA